MRIALLAIAALGAGCRAPTEMRHAVSAERAPLLPEPEADEPAMVTLARGELVELGHPTPPVTWSGTVEGEPFSRSGPMVEVKRSSGETAIYLFAGDVGGEVAVPSARWLCEKMAGGPDCPSHLRRAILDGGSILAYEPCGIGPCRIAVAAQGKVSAATLDGLGDATPLTVGGHPFALARSRWVKGPTWTGGSVTVYRLAPRLERILVIAAEEIDARAAPSIQRSGRLTVEGDHLVFRGTRRELSASGAILYEKPLVETYLLPKR